MRLQAPHLPLARQQTVDRFRRDLLEQSGDVLTALQPTAGTQPIHLLPQNRRQSLPAGVVEQLPNLCQRRYQFHAVSGSPHGRRGRSAAADGTRVTFRISTFRFSLVRLRASFNNRVFCFLLPRRYSSRSAARYCSRECLSHPASTPIRLPSGPGRLARTVTLSFDPTRGLSVTIWMTQFAGMRERGFRVYTEQKPGIQVRDSDSQGRSP